MNVIRILAGQFTVTPDQIGIPNVQANGATLNSILAQVFALAGAMAFIFLLVGAFKYVSSNGDQSQVKQAKETMIYAVIGLVVAVSAYAIIQFVSDRVTG